MKDKQPLDKEDQRTATCWTRVAKTNSPTVAAACFPSTPFVWHDNNIKAVQLERPRYCHHMKYACIFFFLFVLRFFFSFVLKRLPNLSLLWKLIVCPLKIMNKIRVASSCFSIIAFCTKTWTEPDAAQWMTRESRIQTLFSVFQCIYFIYFLSFYSHLIG